MPRQRKISSALWLAVLLVPIHLCGPARICAEAGDPAQAAPVPNGKPDRAKDQKITGLSVIVKADSVAGDPLFHADGYRIRIMTPGTDASFDDSLNSLADVTPGTWIRFEGVRDQSGVVVASKAQFYAAGTRKGLTKMGPSKVKKTADYRPVLEDSVINAEGDLVSALTKIAPRDADALCAWYKVPADAALQDRVERIGLRLVPEYQKQMPLDIPGRISFRFYIVSDDRVDSGLDCKPGLVLLPKRYVERLQNDDQLAAVLADEVAFNLMRQLGGFVFRRPEGVGKGTAVAAGMAAAASPWAGPWPLEVVASHTATAELEQGRARIALQLMDDAGFDPWQAPQAWRLLAPRKLPRNIQSLKDTRESKYQSSILNLQYKRGSETVAGSEKAESH